MHTGELEVCILMAKTQKTDNAVRTTITIPPDVKKRMDAADSGVNWSAVATEAFRAKLLDLESSKRVETMTDAIERLRAADKQDGSEEYEAGVEVGETWAKEKARPKQLRRLAKAAEEMELRWQTDLATQIETLLEQGSDIREFLYETIGGLDLQDAPCFWEDSLGESQAAELNSAMFAQGFVAGALTFWESVEDKI